MKRIYLLLLGVVVIQLVNAQSSPLMIFDRFIDAKIHFKNRSVTVVPMNYDAANDKMYFISGDNYMELTNAAMIDSISWAKQRCFVPSMQGYLEKKQFKQWYCLHSLENSKCECRCKRCYGDSYTSKGGTDQYTFYGCILLG